VPRSDPIAPAWWRTELEERRHGVRRGLAYSGAPLLVAPTALPAGRWSDGSLRRERGRFGWLPAVRQPRWFLQSCGARPRDAGGARFAGAPQLARSAIRSGSREGSTTRDWLPTTPHRLADPGEHGPSAL